MNVEDRYEVLVVRRDGALGATARLASCPKVGDDIDVQGLRVRVVAIKEPSTWWAASRRLICRPLPA